MFQRYLFPKFIKNIVLEIALDDIILMMVNQILLSDKYTLCVLSLYA